MASAAEAMREAAVSARLVSAMGTRAPSTTPQLAAPARYSSCLASMLPASRSGTIRMSAWPATGEAMPLMRAASAEIALSKASGPSSTAPAIWPRSAILHRAAASTVEGMRGVTVSTADRMATLGWATPSARARSTALRTMSALALRSGVMFSAASVTSRGLG
jgi:hypothetical protein